MDINVEEVRQLTDIMKNLLSSDNQLIQKIDIMPPKRIDQRRCTRAAQRKRNARRGESEEERTRRLEINRERNSRSRSRHTEEEREEQNAIDRVRMRRNLAVENRSVETRLQRNLNQRLNHQNRAAGSLDLQEACERCETVQVVLCHILVTSPEMHVRQYSTLLLKKILAKNRQWNKLPLDQQEMIKNGILDALMQEEHDCVRKGIAQVVGVLSVEVEPDQFSPLIDTVCEMLLAALVAHDDADNMVTPIIRNIICGITALVPITLDHNAAEQTLQKAIPLILKTLQAFARHPEVNEFVRAFDILASIVVDNPKIVNNYVKMVAEFCLEISSNIQLDAAIRIKAIDCVGCLVQVKKKMLVKLKLIDPIINTVFNLIAAEPEDDDDGYLRDDDRESPMLSAAKTMDFLALNVPAEKLIPPLLALLGPALRSENPLLRRGAYMTMAVIAEGCSEAICSNYIDVLINFVLEGVTDATPSVRNAAFYALGEFSEELQPDIAKFSSQIMAIFSESLQKLCTELRSGETQLKNIECMFFAIEAFCEKLEDQLVPYLPALMEILLEAIRQDTSVRVRELALCVICAAASATEENMMPYLQCFITILQSFLVERDDENKNRLLPQFIDTLAVLARAVGEDNFKLLTTESMKFALNLITKTDDSDVRRALYNLMAALASVLKEEMASVYPEIIQRIFDSFRSAKEVFIEFPTDDMEQSEDEEEDDKMAHVAHGLENLNLEEKEEAILALKEFAVHTGAAFIPYLELSFQNVSKMIDHSHEKIREASVSALCEFVIALQERQDIEGVTNSITYLLPKLKDIVHDDEEITVVKAALAGIFNLLAELTNEALSSEDLRNCVFACIEDVIQGRASCQHNESEEDEYDISEESELEVEIVEAAERILPILGLCMTPKEFAPYFQRIFPSRVQKLRKAIALNTLDTLRSSTYSCLADCFEPLEDECGALFNTLCPVMLAGLSDKCDEAREYAIHGLGELVLYSKGRSYHAYPDILNALFEALSKEVNPNVLDNICGAISRLIKTNSELVPLAQVLPLYMNNLPLREEFTENLYVLQCFETLYEKAPKLIFTSWLPVVETITQVLFKLEDLEEETCELAKNLLKRMIRDHPELEYAYPEISKSLQTL